jgi:hypothetical protein
MVNVGVRVKASVGLLQLETGKEAASCVPTFQAGMPRMTRQRCRMWCVVCGVWCVVCDMWYTVYGFPAKARATEFS